MGMSRGAFITTIVAGLGAAYVGQRLFLNDPLGKAMGVGEKEPLYEGSDISIAVEKFFNIPGTDLIGITDTTFNKQEELKGKPIKVYADKREFDYPHKNFKKIDKIVDMETKEVLYDRGDRGFISADLPRLELKDKDEYKTPKDFRYANKDSWEKLGTNKIKLIGKISPDRQYIEVRDEKDNEINKIKIENMSTWAQYLLQSELKDKELEIYAIVKKTVDWKERGKTRELFTADVNHVAAKEKQISSLDKLVTTGVLAAGIKKVWDGYQKRYLQPKQA